MQIHFEVHVRLWISLCTGVHTYVYIYVLFMENRATESDRQSRQGACAAFRGWVTNLSTYANQSSNPRRYVVIMANPRLHCSHLSPGIILESPSPLPSPSSRGTHTRTADRISREMTNTRGFIAQLPSLRWFWTGEYSRMPFNYLVIFGLVLQSK